MMVLLTGTAANAATIYSGNLTSSGIMGTAPWNAGVTMSWTVDDVTTPGLWHYAYSFVVPAKDISHFLLEMGLAVMPADLQNAQFSDNGTTWTAFAPTADDLMVFSTAQGNSNPNMPDPMYSLKVPGTALSLFLQFDTVFAPVWGDFYAKDGKNGGVDVTAWNKGFTANDTDPTVPAANGSVNNHVLIPGGDIIPEPATMSLLGLGMVGLLRRRR